MSAFELKKGQTIGDRFASLDTPTAATLSASAAAGLAAAAASGGGHGSSVSSAGLAEIKEGKEGRRASANGGGAKAGKGGAAPRQLQVEKEDDTSEIESGESVHEEGIDEVGATAIDAAAAAVTGNG